MSIIDLFWHLNIDEKTRYLLFLLLIICIIGSCLMNGKRNKKKNIHKNKKKYIHKKKLN